MEKEPCKISITMNGQTYSVEVAHSDLHMEEMLKLLHGLLLAVGYHPKTVKKYLPVW